MTDSSMREAPLTFRSSLEEGHAERQRDTLNLLPCAEALRDVIHECGTPATIGIRGGRGTGKTTLMNMLRGEAGAESSGLLDSEKCLVINFETWSYAQFNHEANLAIASMHALTTAVGDRLMAQEHLDEIGRLEISAVARGAREKLERALRHMKAGVPTGPFKLRGSDGSRDIPPHRDAAAQLIAFRDEFAGLVKHWLEDDDQRRVVFFLDDLDRIAPVAALSLMEALKNFLDAPGCVFVLAVDYDVVQQGVADTPGHGAARGKDFYDRIIELPFVLHAAGYPLEEYITGLLARSGIPGLAGLENDPDSSRFFVDITLCTVGRNPRSIKRVMNCARLLERIRRHRGGGEPEARDTRMLYALACMQVAWPGLYEHFASSPAAGTVTGLRDREYLQALPEARELLDRTHDAEMLVRDVAAFFDMLLSAPAGNSGRQTDAAALGALLDVMSLTGVAAAGARKNPRD